MVITDLLHMKLKYLVLTIPVQEVVNVTDNFLQLRVIGIISKNQILQLMKTVLYQNYSSFSDNMQGMDKIMETQDSIGIKLVVLAALKEY
jgi:hypothetical protein